MSDGLLTLCQATRRIDPDGALQLDRRGRKLGRAIEAAEKRTGHTIGVVYRGPTYRRRKVTLSECRRYLPQLFPDSGPNLDAIERAIRTYMGDLDDRISERCAEQIARDVEPRISELWERDERIARSVLDLAKRVATLAGPDHRDTIATNRPPSPAGEPLGWGEGSGRGAAPRGPSRGQDEPRR